MRGLGHRAHTGGASPTAAMGRLPSMALLRLLYKPFGIIAGIVAGRVGKSLFSKLWMKVDDAPPPRPGTGQGSMPKVVGGAAVEAAVMAATAAAVDRVFAKAFHHLLGIWPKKPKEPKDDED